MTLGMFSSQYTHDSLIHCNLCILLRALSRKLNIGVSSHHILIPDSAPVAHSIKKPRPAFCLQTGIDCISTSSIFWLPLSLPLPLWHILWRKLNSFELKTINFFTFFLCNGLHFFPLCMCGCLRQRRGLMKHVLVVAKCVCMNSR